LFSAENFSREDLALQAYDEVMSMSDEEFDSLGDDFGRRGSISREHKKYYRPGSNVSTRTNKQTRNERGDRIRNKQLQDKINRLRSGGSAPEGSIADARIKALQSQQSEMDIRGGRFIDRSRR
jgi:hypothetical protein